MDRLNRKHQNARVEFPTNTSVSDDQSKNTSPRMFSPAAYEYAALLGIVCWGAAVITAASLIALQIQ